MDAVISSTKASKYEKEIAIYRISGDVMSKLQNWIPDPYQVKNIIPT